MGLVGLVWRCGVRALVWEAHQEGFSLDVISWDDVTLQHSFGDHFWRLHGTQWALSVPKVLIKPSQKPCGTSEEAWLTFAEDKYWLPRGSVWRITVAFACTLITRMCVCICHHFRAAFRSHFTWGYRGVFMFAVSAVPSFTKTLTKHSLNTDTSGPSFISYG